MLPIDKDVRDSTLSSFGQKVFLNGTTVLGLVKLDDLDVLALWGLVLDQDLGLATVRAIRLGENYDVVLGDEVLNKPLGNRICSHTRRSKGRGEEIA